MPIWITLWILYGSPYGSHMDSYIDPIWIPVWIVYGSLYMTIRDMSDSYDTHACSLCHRIPRTPNSMEQRQRRCGARQAMREGSDSRPETGCMKPDPQLSSLRHHLLTGRGHFHCWLPSRAPPSSNTPSVPLTPLNSPDRSRRSRVGRF